MREGTRSYVVGENGPERFIPLSPSSDERLLALAWHIVEFLAVLGLVGVIWAIRHRRAPHRESEK